MGDRQVRGLRRALWTALWCVAGAIPATAQSNTLVGACGTFDFCTRVVQITGRRASPDSLDGERGYGFVVGSSVDPYGKSVFLVVTADHVVRDPSAPGDSYAKPLVTYYVYQDSTFEGTLLDFRVPPTAGDLAILKVPKPPNSSDIRSATMAPVWALTPGTDAWRIGKPGYWLPARAASQYAGPERGVWLRFNGLDAPRGTSGAPMVTERGLVGMVVEDVGVVGGASGEGNALPADLIARNVVGWGISGWDIQPAGSGAAPPPNPSPNPLSDPKKIAERVAALLNPGEKSPAGVPASAVSTALALYSNGVGAAEPDNGKSNWQEAAFWYGLAAKQGHPTAFARLGRIIMLGQTGQLPDPEVAIMLWLRGSQLKDGGNAALMLGRVFEEGDGIPIDPAAAVGWYQVAESQGDKRATAELRRLKKTLLLP